MTLFETIFKRDPRQPGTIEFLKQLTQEHPYFHAAHLFLLSQYEEGSEEYKKAAIKASTVFNNPLWLNYKLNDIKDDLRGQNSAHNASPQQAENLQQKTEEPADKIEENRVKEAIAKMESGDRNAEMVIPIEPLYTTDYFASQGIKISEEEVKPGDKLANQLKSFTEWLRSMKKIHIEKIQQEEQDETDTSIQKLAERSNLDEDVVTEAMAEVLVQQRKQDKAIELYEKLSLLNPAKSAYFAAKIKNIKER